MGYTQSQAGSNGDLGTFGISTDLTGTTEANKRLLFKGPAAKPKNNVTKLYKESDGQCYTRALQKECVCARDLKQSLWGYDKRLRRAQGHT